MDSRQWIHVAGLKIQVVHNELEGNMQAGRALSICKKLYPSKRLELSRVLRCISFTIFMHVCFTSLKTTICSETGWKRGKKKRTFSHFQHSRSHLVLPVLEWQSLLPLDKVYPFLFEMKMSVISFEIDDSLHTGPINEKLMRLSSLF